LFIVDEYQLFTKKGEFFYKTQIDTGLSCKLQVITPMLTPGIKFFRMRKKHGNSDKPE